MGRDAGDIGRQHIGLDPVARQPFGAVGLVDRVHQLENPPGTRGVAQFGKGHAQPGGGMAVLAAILADPRWIGLDVAGFPSGIGERRPEQADQPVLLADQLGGGLLDGEPRPGVGMAAG